MDVRALFGISILMSFVAFGLATKLFIWPHLQTKERDRALLSLMVLGISLLWIVRVWTWKVLSTGDRYTVLCLALIFFVAAILTVCVHGCAWWRERQAPSTGL